VYAGESFNRIEVSKEYTDGATQTTVFEVRERSTVAGDIISNISVLKFGDFLELSKERESYQRIIRPSKTSGFAEIKGISGPYERMGVLRYQSADYFMGARDRQQLRPILEICTRPSWKNGNFHGTERLYQFFDEHLYQALWSKSSRAEKKSIASQYNVFLPARYSVFVDSRDHATGDFVRTGSSDAEVLLSLRLRVSEYQPELNRIRAYTCETGLKVDVFYSNLDEKETYAFREGSIIVVKGELRKERRDTFEKIVLSDTELRKIVADRGHPEDLVQEMLSHEFEAINHGPIHGDLHCGNVLATSNAFCVIDYGKTTSHGLVAHDLALFLADLFIKSGFDVPAMSTSGFLDFIRRRFIRSLSEHDEFIRTINYDLLSDRIKKIIDAKVFWASLSLTFFGYLKFQLNQKQKRSCIYGAYLCYERYKNT
jgi:hypothetical protein